MLFRMICHKNNNIITEELNVHPTLDGAVINVDKGGLAWIPDSESFVSEALHFLKITYQTMPHAKAVIAVHAAATV
jgi:phosphoribosyl 1,2-cyclic phosphodiesterase